jgi:hypothetical protein
MIATTSLRKGNTMRSIEEIQKDLHKVHKALSSLQNRLYKQQHALEVELKEAQRHGWVNHIEFPIVARDRRFGDNEEVIIASKNWHRKPDGDTCRLTKDLTYDLRVFYKDGQVMDVACFDEQFTSRFIFVRELGKDWDDFFNTLKGKS